MQSHFGSAGGGKAVAEPLYLQALELWKRLLGEEHPNTVTIRGVTGGDIKSE